MFRHTKRDEYSEGFFQPHSLPHSGAGKNGFKDRAYQPRLFQQAVTLTATMWNENESERNLQNWKLGSWTVPRKYSPLFVGLACGFLIIFVVTTAVAFWKYCLFSASKKVCRRGTYGIMSRQQGQNSWSASCRKERKKSLQGFQHINQTDAKRKASAFRHSITMGSIIMNSGRIPVMDRVEKGESKHLEENFTKVQSSNSDSEPLQVEPLKSSDANATHSHIRKLYLNSDLPKNLSKSTSILELTSPMVNFSKKRKNRMRKGDAAIIAMSKSRSEDNENSLELTCSSTVVYNERTAL